MIWFVVYCSGGRVTPSNWREKEVYNFGMARKDLPAWMHMLRRRLRGGPKRNIGLKDVIELVDNDSVAPSSSHRGSPDDVFGLETRVQRSGQADTDHQSPYELGPANR